MEYSSVFLKARAIIFSLISLISFIWVVVICVDLFIQWGVLSISERAFLAVMLLSNTLTLIILLVLLILPFRPWLDGARLMLLLVMHIGIASGFALWNAKFTCPTKTVDEEGVCRLLNMYILIANWIIPATLLVYALGLAVMLYKRRKLKAVLPDLESSRSRQPESRQSILPMMVPADIRFPSMSTTPHTSVISQQLRESVWGAGASSSPPQSIVEGKRGSSSGRSRLSKPLSGKGCPSLFVRLDSLNLVVRVMATGNQMNSTQVLLSKLSNTKEEEGV